MRGLGRPRLYSGSAQRLRRRRRRAKRTEPASGLKRSRRCKVECRPRTIVSLCVCSGGGGGGDGRRPGGRSRRPARGTLQSSDLPKAGGQNNDKRSRQTLRSAWRPTRSPEDISTDCFCACVYVRSRLSVCRSVAREIRAPGRPCSYISVSSVCHDLRQMGGSARSSPGALIYRRGSGPPGLCIRSDVWCTRPETVGGSRVAALTRVMTPMC